METSYLCLRRADINSRVGQQHIRDCSWTNFHSPWECTVRNFSKQLRLHKQIQAATHHFTLVLEQNYLTYPLHTFGRLWQEERRRDSCIAVSLSLKLLTASNISVPESLHTLDHTSIHFFPDVL